MRYQFLFLLLFLFQKITLMNNIECCICGPVKNCSPYLDKVLENIEKIGSLFKDYKIVIFYDESNDGSLSKLINYQKKNNKLNLYIGMMII